MFTEQHIDDIMQRYDDQDERRRVRVVVSKAQRVRKDSRGRKAGR